MNPNFEQFLTDAGDKVTAHPVQDGVFTIHLRDWNLLDQLLSTMRNTSHAIYRGVRSSSFDLTPSIFREPYRSVILQQNGSRIEDIIQRYVTHFRLAIRDEGAPIPRSWDFTKHGLWADTTVSSLLYSTGRPHHT